MRRIRLAKMVLKIDLENAFNEVLRDAILAEILEHFPELEPWFRLCYGKAAVLSCNGTILPFRSERGVQQGDPLAPFFFALALRRGCARLRAELSADTLSVWYLDDGTIVGPPDDVVKGWNIIKDETAKVGLKVNTTKCELFGACPEALKPAFTGVKLLGEDGLELLGSPIGTDAFCTSYVMERIGRIEEALKNLSVIDDSQCEYLLLRSCLGYPKMAFALRSAPPSVSPRH